MILDKYINDKLVEKKGNMYIIKLEGAKKPISLGMGIDLANKKLEALIKEGKVIDLTIASPPPPPEAPGEKPPSDLKTDIEVLESESIPTPTKNPKLESLPEVPDVISKADALKASKLGDIKKRGKHGKFIVFIHGVDSRLENHPVVKRHKYVYRHCTSAKSVPSAGTVLNDGYSVLSKQMNPIDPRTSKQEITVAYDSTPDADYYSVGKQVLCYASKEQFEEKKGQKCLEDTIRTPETLDARQEESERLAKQSTVPGEAQGTIDEYRANNDSQKAVTAEFLEENQGFSKEESKAAMNSIGSKIEQAKMGKGPGRFKTLKSTTNIQDI